MQRDENVAAEKTLQIVHVIFCAIFQVKEDKKAYRVETAGEWVTDDRISMLIIYSY